MEICQENQGMIISYIIIFNFSPLSLSPVLIKGPALLRKLYI